MNSCLWAVHRAVRRALNEGAGRCGLAVLLLAVLVGGSPAEVQAGDERGPQPAVDKHAERPVSAVFDLQNVPGRFVEASASGDVARLLTGHSPATERMLAMVLRSIVTGSFWGDVQFFRGWRIQQYAATERTRLLSPDGRCVARGTLDECRAVLRLERERLGLAPLEGPCVILLHGIVRSSSSMLALAKSFEQAGYQVFCMDYASTFLTIPEAADRLQTVIENLEGVSEINLVVHSMGGLVVRAWSQRHRDPRMGRCVMLGTPNHGAELADQFHGFWLFRAIFGPAGCQLVTDANGLIPRLPQPSMPFAIIAGARGNAIGWNPLIPGDDDVTVTVRSARLAGATDFATIPATHMSMLRHALALEYAVRFIRHGALRPSGTPEPIPHAEKVAPPMSEPMVSTESPQPVPVAP